MEALSGSDELLKTLLDLSTLEAGIVTTEIRDLSLETLFARLLDECAPMALAKGLDLRVVPSGLIVRSDPVILQRMIRNLLNNAIRYTSTGKVLLGCRRRGCHVLIAVVDTGCGIPPGQEDLIFEEFYQVGNSGRSRAEGLGLGLSIVRRQARLLDSPPFVKQKAVYVDWPMLAKIDEALRACERLCLSRSPGYLTKKMMILMSLHAKMSPRYRVGTRWPSRRWPAALRCRRFNKIDSGKPFSAGANELPLLTMQSYSEATTVFPGSYSVPFLSIAQATARRRSPTVRRVRP
jgi:hypothetical protein